MKSSPDKLLRREHTNTKSLNIGMAYSRNVAHMHLNTTLNQMLSMPMCVMLVTK